MPNHELLRVQEMYAADAAAIAGGVTGLELMESAGAGIAEAIRHRWPKGRVKVLCGPGNNGGDGFVVARLLDQQGWPVEVALLGDPARLAGDAAVNAGRWTGPIAALDVAGLAGADLVVDALFGAGLTRPLDGTARDVIAALNGLDVPVVAVDVPSGVDGDTGAVRPLAPRADLTVTFFRFKPGHFLYPGAAHCGDLRVVDIGIPEGVLADIGPKTALNGPFAWPDVPPSAARDSHKYSHGHVVICGGAVMTGAARLAARGARRMGAGLVTIACPPETFALYAADQPGTLVAPMDSNDAFTGFIADPRRNVVVIGPGAGDGDGTMIRTLRALEAGKACVIDADALSIFAANPKPLFSHITGACVLTPHEGEFQRLFPDLRGGKVARALAAARCSGAVVVLKGPDTVIASPDGAAVINTNAPPELATAGSGDVLAGFVAGLLANGVAAFEAACAAVWMHGEAATRFGPGLIAEDLPEALPAVLGELAAAKVLTG